MPELADPVAFLEAEFGRVEKLARATTVYQPYDEWTPVGVEKDDDVARSCWEVALIARPVVRSPSARALMEHIAEHDPVSVLRRVAADRQILAEHASDGNSRWPECARCAGGHEIEIGECMTVTVRDEVPWPCRTVLLLAEAWGWTEES